MRKLQFKTPEDFQEVFTSRKVMVTDAIVDSIEQAVMHNKKTANIFEVTFEEAEQLFEIALPLIEWVNALEAALDHYHEIEEADKCIDTWKLLEAVKTL